MNYTENAIKDAFWQLLEEKPYNKITVKDIVERCQENRILLNVTSKSDPMISYRHTADSVLPSNVSLRLSGTLPNTGKRFCIYTILCKKISFWLIWKNSRTIS